MAAPKAVCACLLLSLVALAAVAEATEHTESRYCCEMRKKCEKLCKGNEMVSISHPLWVLRPTLRELSASVPPATPAGHHVQG